MNFQLYELDKLRAKHAGYRLLLRLSADYLRLRGTYQGVTNSFATVSPSSRPQTDADFTRTYAEFYFCVYPRSFRVDPRVFSKKRPFDLHALSTPPAFILDQDQIL